MSDPQSTRPGSARPRQLTLAASFVIGGSALLVLTAFDSLARLTSVQKRQDVGEMLSTPPFDGVGLSVDDVLAITRVGLMVAAACAAAAVVLGIFVLQRHRGARVALSVVAVPLVLSTFATGDLLGALVAAATLVLWTGPARDWFAGRPVREPERPGRGRRTGGSDQQDRPDPWAVPPVQESAPPQDDRVPPTLSTTTSSQAPPATSGFGERATAVAERPAAWPVPAGGPPAGARLAVPATVKMACLLTWAFAGVVALMYAGLLVYLAIDADRLVDFVVSSPEWERADLDRSLILPMLWVGCLMFLGWSLGACVLAFFTWRRHNWARWLLAASAATALVAAVFAFPVGMLHQAAAALAIGGLFSAAARAWFANAPVSGPPAPPGPPGPPGGFGHGQLQGPPVDHPAGHPAGHTGSPEQPSGPGSSGPSGDRPTPDGRPPVW